jgi:hypothetical protein
MLVVEICSHKTQVANASAENINTFASAESMPLCSMQ